jgi:hypothetical protein
MDKQGVPLQVGWLSENNLLVRAGELLGYKVFQASDGTLRDATVEGVEVWGRGEQVATTSGTRTALVRQFLLWEDYMLFTVAQLQELGFS